MAAFLSSQSRQVSENLLHDPFVGCEGKVVRVSGLSVGISDRLGLLELGTRVDICAADGGEPVRAEIVSLGNGEATALPFGSTLGIHRGSRVLFSGSHEALRPTHGWLGRVIDGLGQPVDGLGALPTGTKSMNLRQSPPPAAQRARLGQRVDFGVKALNAFTPARAGQRLGIFSGSGVGKSALLGMVARNTDCDVRIIALIGERGREVREFIEDDLGPEGLARSIVIVATADEPALMRREAGFFAMALSEYFRDQGLKVLCLMDSLTRIAMAQREIGLAAGEPPASRGYTPSVFSLLPGLLERAGPGIAVDPDHPHRESGSITGLFTVLVEGDDHDEPIADHARAILDGHIVLDRAIAERGRFPAVNILKSISRNASDAMSAEECSDYIRARQMAAHYENMADMVRIGAYQRGTSPDLDTAIDFCASLEEFLTQSRDSAVGVRETRLLLSKIVAEASLT